MNGSSVVQRTKRRKVPPVSDQTESVIGLGTERRTAARGANARQVGGAHYRAELQHWDVIEAYGIGYLEGCASKYVTRARKKNGLQDVEKCGHYIEKLIELHDNGEGRQPRGKVPLYVCFQFVEMNKLTALEGTIATLLLTWTSVSQLHYAAKLNAQLYESIKSGAASSAPVAVAPGATN